MISFGVLVALAIIAVLSAIWLCMRLWQGRQALDAAAAELDQTRAALAAAVATNVQAQAFIQMQTSSEPAAERQRITNQLRTAVDLIEQSGTLMDANQLVHTITQQLQSAFNLYNVTVFLFDETDNALQHIGNANRAGAILKPEEETIPLDHPRSVIARAARNHEVAVINNSAERDDFLEHPAFPHMQSEAAFPLVFEGKLTGVLDVQDDKPNRFRTADIDTISAVATHLAINLERARLFADLQHALRDLHTLNDITATVNTSLNLQEVLDTAAAKMVALVRQVSHCGIGLFNADQSALRIVSEYPESGARDLVLLTAETPTVQALIANPQTFVIQDTASEKTTLGAIRKQFLKLGIRTTLIVPIVANSRLIGSIGLDVIGKTHNFSADEIVLMEAVANQVAIAVDKARLFAESEAAKNAAEAANRAKSTFLANMNHELRTPLNAIIGYCELLVEQAADIGSEELIPDLKKIHHAGTHLLQLISDILDLSMIEVGRMQLNTTRFEVQAAVDAAVNAMRSTLRNSTNSFKLECVKPLGVMTADRAKTESILINLLDNAVKFTDHGSIELHVDRTEQDGIGFVRFTVKDTGIGMTAEQLDKLFRPFTQGDMTHTRRFGGSGLGLTLSLQYCQMMGGQIEANSEVGSGSEFTVVLPAVAHTAESTSTTLAAPPLTHPTTFRGSGQRALIIDDDPNACDLLGRLLVAEGFEPYTAVTGQAGLTLAHDLQPDLITLDIILPDMSGWDILGQLKASNELANIPVIITSIVDEKERGYSLGANGYLVKPIAKETLQAQLETMSEA